MPYIGVSPPSAPLTSSDIADSIITEAKMADDAISLAELKAGTDGEIISWDASGNPVAIGAGSSGEFLKSQGAGSQPVFAAAGGGAWTFISKTTISNNSEIDIESGIDSTYPLYAFVCNKVKVVTDNARLYARVKVSSFQTGSNYEYHVMEARSYSSSSWVNGSNAATGGDHIRMITDNGQGNASTESINLIFYLPAPADTTIHKNCWWHGTNIREDTQLAFTQGFGGYDGGTGAITGMRFYAHSGNLDSGTITMYGIKDS